MKSAPSDRFRPSLPVLTVMALVAAACAALVWWWIQPTRLRIALDAPPSLASDILARYATLTLREANNIRLATQDVPDSAERARQLDADRVDIAVFRLDEMLPANGSAVALVNGEAILIVARAAARVAKIPDLRQKRLGIVQAHAADDSLVRRVIEAYRIEVQAIPLANDAAGREALQAGRIDALALVAQANGQRSRALFAGLLGQGGGAPVLLPVDASVVKSVLPHAEEATVSASVIDPRRGFPAEDVTTVGVKRVVLAARKRSNSQISAFTRLLFERRDQLAQLNPSFAALTAPSTDRGASVPVHPGAAEYIDANEMTFFTRYSDLIWIGLCFTGVFGSMWGAVYTRYRFSKEYGLTSILAEIAATGEKAIAQPNLTDLRTLERQLTQHVLVAAQDPRFASDEQAIALMKFTFGVAMAGVAARRRELEARERRSRNGLRPVPRRRCLREGGIAEALACQNAASLPLPEPGNGSTALGLEDLDDVAQLEPVGPRARSRIHPA